MAEALSGKEVFKLFYSTDLSVFFAVSFSFLKLQFATLECVSEE